MKLKHLSMHSMNNVPEHIMEEINSLTNDMLDAIGPLTKEYHSNIVLAAFNILHCSMLKLFISDNPGELEKAVLVECQSLIKNTELLAGREFKFEEK